MSEGDSPLSDLEFIDSSSNSSSDQSSSPPLSDSINNNWSFHPLLLPSTTNSNLLDWSEGIKSVSLLQQNQFQQQPQPQPQQLPVQQQQQQPLLQQQQSSNLNEMELTSDFWNNDNNLNNSGNNFNNNNNNNNNNNEFNQDYDMNGNYIQLQTDDLIGFPDVYSPSSTLNSNNPLSKSSPAVVPLASNSTTSTSSSSHYIPSFTIPHDSNTFCSPMTISPQLTHSNSNVTSPNSTTINPFDNHSNFINGVNNGSNSRLAQFQLQGDDEDLEEEEDREESMELEEEQEDDRRSNNEASTSGSGEREKERTTNTTKTSKLKLSNSQIKLNSTINPSSSNTKREAISTNLVAKDAIVASTIILSCITAPIPSNSNEKLKLLVLGVPIVGAKSRVETQIKISLVLVKPKFKGKNKIKSENGMEEEEFMTSDGGLNLNAGNSLDRIGSWTHLKLPHYLALKKKGKKVLPEPTPEETLYLDVQLKRGSESTDEIFICQGCRQREEKRALRKKEARVKPPKESELPAVDGGESEEMRKVVVFNCSEFVEFGEGEVVLPTRITCYCRHHKEKLGFSVAFTLTTSAGMIIATGATPPIMITDDHKTNHLRPTTNPNSSADVSLDSIEFKPKGKKSKATTPVVTSNSSKKSELSKTKRSSGRPKSTRGALVESEDELLPEPSGRIPSSTSNPNPNSNTNTAKKHGLAKPYDSDSRPTRSKRNSTGGVHRSPAFAMTPLSGVSKPTSPVLRAQSDQSINIGIPSPPLSSLYDSTAPSPNNQNNWETSLGLGGMDSFMGDATATINNNLSNSGTNYSNSINSPGSQSYDWRSAASSPSANSVIENNTYNNNPFYNQQPIHSPSGLSPNSNLLNNSSNNNIIIPSQSQLLQLQPQVSQALGDFTGFYNAPVPSSVVSSAFNWAFPTPAPLPPKISRLIPGEGPIQGGIEVTILGENFVRDLVCVFGDSTAVSTHYWSSNTLVAILPPSANPGPVVVAIKGVPLTVEVGSQLQLFTYKDDADRSLLELALQVVGLKMTGKLEEASAVAMRIVGENGTNNNSNSTSRQNSRQTSPNDNTSAAGLAMSMNAAADSVYNTPNNSRPPSRQASIVNLSSLNSSISPSTPLNSSTSSSAFNLNNSGIAALGGQSRNFEGIVIKFLSLIDLDPSQIPGSAPSVPLTLSPLSHLNAQGHSLLHLATVLGFHKLTKFLITRGINLAAVDRNGATALHFAALYGRVTITRQLLDAGAASYTRNRSNQTPLDIARERDDVDIEELLLRPRPVPSTTTSIATPIISRPSLQHQQSIYQSYPSPPISTSTPIYSRRNSYDSTVDVRGYSDDDSSNYDNSSSSDNSNSDDDDDDASFHSSDEDGQISDEERGYSRSRNASVISLAHLANVEDSTITLPPPTTIDFNSIDEKKLSNILSGAELARKTSSTTTLSPSELDLISKLPLLEKKLPLNATGGGGGGVWEKIPKLPYANEAWEKMRLPNSFGMPLQIQMPELSVFNASIPNFSPTTWMRATRSEGNSSGVEGGESEGENGIDGVAGGKLGRDWRNLYNPWWQKGGASPPPPMYSPIDTLQLNSTPSTSTLLPSAPIIASSSRNVYSIPTSQLNRRSSRSVEFNSNSGSGEENSPIQSLHLLRQDNTKLQGLKQDKMLFFFWLPILILVLGLAVFSSLGSIKPFIYNIL